MSQKDALFKRLRTGGDQIFPIGWALWYCSVPEEPITGTFSSEGHQGNVFVPLADMEEVDNADINQRLLEAIEQITDYSQQIRVAIEDGVIEHMKSRDC